LSSWILVISAPFYSLLILISLVMLLKLAGNYFLIFGVLVLTLNPWIYVVFRRLYVSGGALSDEDEKRLDLVQKSAGISNLAGFILVFIWAYKSGMIEYYGTVTPRGLVRFVVVTFGNGLITSIVFCDAFLHMTVTNWKTESKIREGDSGSMIDELFQTIEGSIRTVENASANNMGAVGEETDQRDIENGSSPSPSASVKNASARKMGAIDQETEEKDIDVGSISSLSRPVPENDKA
jgi:hypothetical protein